MNTFPMQWYPCTNWGDSLSPYLAEKISGRKPLLTGSGRDRMMAIGSILQYADERAKVWGTGFINSQHTVRGQPQISAVRGPLTFMQLIRDGWKCPEVYGDPALLLPRYFNPKVEKQYAVGIVPHFTDRGHLWLNEYRSRSDVLIIDVMSPTEEFVKQVKSCVVIVTSALHPSICADAYGIPNAIMELRGKIGGDGMKFADYRQSIGCDELYPHPIMPLEDILERTRLRELKIDLDLLLSVCPFRGDLF